MGIEHALRLARGARGIAQRARRPLIQQRPGVFRILTGDERLITHDGHAQRGQGGLAHHHHHAQRFRQPLGQRHQPRQQRGIDKQRHIGGIIQNIGDLVGKQPRIDRVQHRPHAGGSVIHLHMRRGVPAQRRHPLAAPNAQPGQGMRQLRRARGHGGVGGACHRPSGIHADQLRSAMMLRRMGQDGGYEQRVLLHQAKHQRLPVVFLGQHSIGQDVS